MKQAGDHRYPTLTLDTERYQAMIDAPDVSDADKAKLIETLWDVVIGFIDLNIEVLTADSCGQARNCCACAPSPAPPVVSSSIPKLTVDFGAAVFTAANTDKNQDNKEAS